MRLIVNILFLIFLLSHHASASAIVFYVSPFGSDTWSGLSPKVSADNTEGPFHTLSRARAAIRTLKINEVKSEQITVKVASGEYFLNQILLFDSRDSGWEGKEIVWEGAGKKPVIVNAGKTLLNCSKNGSSTWTCNTNVLDLAKVKPADNNRIKGNIPGFALYVNNRYLQLTRWPDKGWAYIKRPIDQYREFTYFDQPGLNIKNPRDTAVHIWPGNDWYDQYLGIASIDTVHKTITLDNPTAYPISPGRRFAIINNETQLDTPWEWFYSMENKKIHFILPKDIQPKTVTITYLENAFVLNDVKNLVLKNLQIHNASGAGIRIRNGHNIQLINLEVANVGGRGIEALNSKRVVIRDNQIHDTGLGGILLTGGNKEKLIKSGNLIDNTHIYEVGQTLANYSPAIDLKGVGSSVRHNLIEYIPGVAIWIEGNEHLIEKNEIHHVCEQASDCGAIYSGRDWTYRGNIIRFNSIHDLYGHGLKRIDQSTGLVEYGSGGVRGVYLDDGASGFRVTGNIFHNAGFISIQIGGGRDNTIENNAIITDQSAIWIDNRWPGYKWEINRKRLASSPYRSLPWRTKYPSLAKPMPNDTWPEGNRITRNIIVSTKANAISLRYFIPTYSNVIGNNIIWNNSHAFRVDFKLLDYGRKKWGATWSEWIAEGVEHKSTRIDPCIELQENRLWSCAPDVQKRIDFQPLPDDIGLYILRP